MMAWFHRPVPHRPATRLTEPEVLAIARATPLGTGGFELGVNAVTETEQGLEWQVGDLAIGATRWFRISDATGAIIASGRHHTR